MSGELRRAATDVRRLYARRRIARFVSTHFDEIARRVADAQRGPVETAPPRVYVYWAQGFTDAPPIVRLCHEQLLKHHPSDCVVVLDDTNLHRFVTVPEWARAKIGADTTKLSNMIRAELLSTYGGVWLDATCFVRANVLDVVPELLSSGFFAFKREDRPLANWFLACRPADYVMLTWREAQYVYWRHFDKKLDYFIAHLIFGALCEVDEEFGAQWAATPTLNAEPPHAFQRAMHEPYDEARFEDLLEGCFVHKLTHKFDPSLLESDTLLWHLFAVAQADPESAPSA